VLATSPLRQKFERDGLLPFQNFTS